MSPTIGSQRLPGAAHVLLVETTPHNAELAPPGTQAHEPALMKIERSLKEVRAAIAPRSSAEWTSTFYQYVNRLAFLYLLRKNGYDAHLLHVLFVGAADVGGPSNADEWKGALKLLRAALGLTDHKLKSYVHEVYIDAKNCDTASLPALAIGVGPSRS